MKAPRSRFDYRNITGIIQRSLATAGLLPREGPAGGRTFEGEAHEVGSRQADDEAPQRFAGESVTRSFTNHAGTRSYKLYIPASHARSAAEAMPLVLMLHGCSQTPDDFAAGTRMNSLADQHGFLVAYPAQSRQANKSGCWQWYSPAHQQSTGGEPAILAGIVREVMSHHRVDPGRVFAAGLSAGGAMAVILGATHPELFAAVGAHSALPYGAAHDVNSAFAVMKGGAASRSTAAIRTIVFHGANDTTVNVQNGAAIAEAVTTSSRGSELRLERHSGRSADGRAYERTVYLDAAGRAVVEHWLISQAGHAWSGGSAKGSFTDAAGPDASAEMIRFFLG